MPRRRRRFMLEPVSAALLLLVTISPFAEAQFTMQEARDIAAYPLNMEKATNTYQAAIELARLVASDAGLNRQLQSGGQDTLQAQNSHV